MPGLYELLSVRCSSIVNRHSIQLASAGEMLLKPDVTLASKVLIPSSVDDDLFTFAAEIPLELISCLSKWYANTLQEDFETITLTIESQ